MKVNPVKCTFGVDLGWFLGFIVTERGIEEKMKKIRAIMEMKALQTIIEVQKLTGQHVALSPFVLEATNKCLPFFGVLRNANTSKSECDKTFKELKKYLFSPTLLKQPKLNDTLLIYLLVFPHVGLTPLIKEETWGKNLLYYISRAFRGVELRYSQMEILAFALVTIAMQMRPYFQTT